MVLYSAGGSTRVVPQVFEQFEDTRAHTPPFRGKRGEGHHVQLAGVHGRVALHHGQGRKAAVVDKTSVVGATSDDKPKGH